MACMPFKAYAPRMKQVRLILSDALFSISLSLCCSTMAQYFSTSDVVLCFLSLYEFLSISQLIYLSLYIFQHLSIRPPTNHTCSHATMFIIKLLLLYMCIIGESSIPIPIPIPIPARTKGCSRISHHPYRSTTTENSTRKISPSLPSLLLYVL